MQLSKHCHRPHAAPVPGAVPVGFRLVVERQADAVPEVSHPVHCSQDHGMKQEPALVAGITSSPEPRRQDARPAIVRIEDIH